MKGKRCYLCGGKLSDGRCIECGLDNLKSERKSYRLNSSSYEKKMHSPGSVSDANSEKARAGRSAAAQKKQDERNEGLAKARVEREADLTKSYEDRKKKTDQAAAGYIVHNAGRSPQKGTLRNTGYTKQKLGGISKNNMTKLTGVIITLVIAVGSLVTEYISKNDLSSSEIESVPVEEQDPYEFVQRELSTEGVDYEVILLPGEYQAGVHIPEGNYQVILEEGSGNVSVDDIENSIYLWQAIGTNEEHDEVEQWDDVRIYSGAVIEVTGNLQVQLKTDCAQSSAMPSMQENPLTQNITLTKGKEVTAGEDFPAGVYDIVSTGEWTYVACKIPMYTDFEEEELNYRTQSQWISEDGLDSTYRNLVIPSGAQIYAENADVQLIPSEFIISEDYDSYYDRYR